MAAHNEKGKKGEEMAAAWLENKGYQIVARNWRAGRYELDLVAKKDEVLHFFEIKMRSSNARGYPEENVTRKKLRDFMQAAEIYLITHPSYRVIQFNVLAITWNGFTDPEYFLIEDVYL
jgi:putative endonuclease